MQVIRPPYSDRQINWAFAAERRGELAPGTAHMWAARQKHRENYGDPATIEVTEHPAGWRHSKASVKKIGELIQEGGHDPLIRQVAIRITSNIPSKSPTQEIAAIYQWIRRNIRFRYDPTGMEWLQTASRTLKERAGDCDCLTILIGSLCQSIGHKTLTRTVGSSKYAPEHVSALVWDRKRWISCDPVLEGPGDTGADLPGNFAAYALGPAIVWDLEGKKMLGNYGIQLTSQELSLWQFAPSFRSQTPAPKPDRRYSRAHVPTFGAHGRCYARPSYYDGIGYYWLPSEIPGEMHEAYFSDADGFGAWGWLKKIGRAVGGIAKGIVSTVVPGAGAIISAGEALLSPGGGGGGAAALPPGATPAQIKAAAASARTAAAATRAITATPLEIKKVGQSTAEIQHTLAQMAAAQAAQGTAVAYLPKISAAVQALPAALPSIEGRVNALISYLRVKDAKALKAKANARKKLLAKLASAKSRKAQLAAMRKIARSEMSKASVKGKKLQLAGLGLRPSLSLSFGGFSDIATARAAAQKAVDRVNLFISRIGKPPQVAIPEVKAFQVADGKLYPDGLWGNNGKAAAEWYLNKAAPPVANAPHFRNPVTWTPPAAAAPAPTPVIGPMKPAAVIVPRPAPRPAPAIVQPRPAPRVIQAKPQIITAPIHRPPMSPINAPRPTPVIIPRPAPRPAPIAVRPTAPRPTPVIIPRPAPRPAPIHAAIAKIPAKTKRKIAKDVLPTRAEIIRLEIASARGDKALLMELARVNRATTRRAKKAVHKVRRYLNGNTKTPTTAKRRDLSAFWPVLAVLALSNN